MTIGRASAIALALGAALAGCSSSDPDAKGPPPREVPRVARPMPATVVDPAASASLRSFAGRDTNHDGVLTSAENAAAAARLFNAVDRDGDGEMSAAEIDAARKALKLAPKPTSPELIARGDQDGDGELTLAEWIALESGDFRAADVNGDGVLSEREFLTKPMLRPGAPAAPAH